MRSFYEVQHYGMVSVKQSVCIHVPHPEITRVTLQWRSVFIFLVVNTNRVQYNTFKEIRSLNIVNCIHTLHFHISS